MKPQLDTPLSPARALGHSTTTAAEAVKDEAINALGVSIDRILRLMRECDDPGRKIRLNETLYVATQELAAVLRLQPRMSVDQ